MDLLNLCLTSTYFQYNGKHYKQLHGTAMGSPVSVVVAELVVQHVEERALATCRQTIPLWLCYVDDTFTAVHKDELDDFHDHLNEQNADIQFTKEIEDLKWKTSFSRPFGKPRQQRTTKDIVQKTDTYRQITGRSILQPDFTQSHDYKDATSL